jgi:hypothetical protein
MGHYIFTGLERTTYKFYFKKTLLSAEMENTLNGEKMLKLNITRLIVEHHETKFRSSLPT